MLRYELMNMFLLSSTMFVYSSIIIMVKNNLKNQLRLMTIVIHVESSTTQQKEKKRGDKTFKEKHKKVPMYFITKKIQNKYDEEESKLVDETIRFEFGDYFPFQMELIQYEKIGGFAIKLVTQF